MAASRGQGFGLTKDERRAVEMHAMARATRHFAAKWDTVLDVSARCSYDLLCRTGKEELRVEVKGTTSAGDQVVMTRREVEEAAQPGYALFVCAGITLRHNGDEVLTSGGVCRVLLVWDASRHQIVPIACLVSLDWADGEAVDGL